jgi:hypothetical protein
MNRGLFTSVQVGDEIAWGHDMICPGVHKDTSFYLGASMLQGLDPRHGSMLLDSTAVRGEFLHSLADLVAITGPHDLAIVSYAGHGMQVPDRDGDEVDRLDEAFCFYDNKVTDDEVADIIITAAEGSCWFFCTDSCHSETSLRSPPLSLNRGDRDFKNFKGHLIHFAGCRDNQSSLGSRAGGEFTNAFRDVFRRNLHDVSYAEAIRNIQNVVELGSAGVQSPVATQINVPEWFWHSKVFTRDGNT